MPFISAQYPSGNLCQEDAQCQTNNCENAVCCQAGKLCCNFDSECPLDYECGINYYCVPKPISLSPEVTEVQFAPPEQIEDPEFCAEGCLEQWVGDGLCDPACNVAECQFDGNDCDHIDLERVGGLCEVNDECATGNCNNGLCCPAGQICCNSASDCPSGQTCNALKFCQSAPREQCGPDCAVDWIADGECQLECIMCDFDGGDCLQREGEPTLSPGESGLDSCGFQGELMDYGRCVFTVFGKTETIPGLELIPLTPYCGTAEKLTNALTKESSDEQIITASEETVAALTYLTDNRLVFEKYADILECFDTIAPMNQRNLKKSLDATAAAYYTQTFTSATAFISDTNVDIIIENDENKFGVDENRYLYKDRAGTTYKQLQNSEIKFVLIPDLRVSGNTYIANGVAEGDTTFTIIEARRGSKDYIEFNSLKTSEDSVFRIEGTYLESDYNGDGIFEQINIRPALVEEESLSLFSQEELVKYVIPCAILIIFIGILFLIRYVRSKKN